MALAVQSVIGAVGGATGQTVSPTATGSAVGTGSLVIGAAIYFSTPSGDSIVSVTDNLSQSYTLLDHLSDGSSIRWMTTFYRFNVTGGPTGLTANFNVSPAITSSQVVWLEYTNLQLARIVGHGGQSQNTPGTATDAISSGSITTGYGPVLGFSINRLGTVTAAVGTNYGLEVQDSNTLDWGFIAEEISGTGGSLAATFTDTTNGSSAGQIYVNSVIALDSQFLRYMDQAPPKTPFQFNRTYVFPDLLLQSLSGKDVLPKNQRDWPLPKVAFQPNRGLAISYSRPLEGKDVLPKNQYYWPLPKVAKQGRTPDLDTWGTLWNLALLTVIQFPFNQYDWPLPTRARPGRTRDLDTQAAWYNQNLIGLDTLPFSQDDWPNPKTPFQPNRGYSQWYAPGLVGQDVLPFNQDDWPLPQRPKPGRTRDLDSFTSWYTLALRGADALPFNQDDWPNPKKPFQFNRGVAAWYPPPLVGKDVLPKNQSYWPNPKTSFQFNRAFNLWTPRGLIAKDALPFRQMQWPLPLVRASTVFQPVGGYWVAPVQPPPPPTTLTEPQNFIVNFQRLMGRR